MYLRLIFFINAMMITWSIAAQTNMVSLKEQRSVVLDDVCPKLKVIDSVRARIRYNAASMTDTVSKSVGRTVMVLDVGKQYRKYYADLNSDMYYLLKNYNKFETSSTIGYHIDVNIWATTIHEVIYFNMPVGKCTVAGRIGAMDFKYEEALPEIDWVIMDSVRTIGDYVAQQAVCTYKGRDYVAWFTSEIPLPYGPWEFCGLPGLILSIGDSEGHYTFEFDRISTPSASVYMPEYDYVKTTRSRYLKMKSQIEADFQYYWGNYSGNSGISFGYPENYKVKKLKNDFIERE